MSEEEHFQRLVTLSAHEREAYLADLNDSELADRLRRLLFAHSDGESLMSVEGLESTAASLESTDATIIGPYKLREQIGEGGMGTVYVAEQEKPVRRKVALKIIKAGMDTKSVVARFEAERQALALMDHPNIARVLDAGSTDAGRPYFVMELVRGIPLTDYCDQQQLTVRQRIQLFVKVCQAIQHAHQKGIIHRDIKPTNVLVTEHDSVRPPRSSSSVMLSCPILNSAGSLQMRLSVSVTRS